MMVSLGKFASFSCKSSIIAMGIALLGQLFVASPSDAQNRPSFDCRRAATTTEYLICDERQLSRLDREMADAYQTLRASVRGREKRRVRQDQTNWRRARDACGGQYNCVENAYIQRIDDLNYEINNQAPVYEPPRRPRPQRPPAGGRASVWDHNGSTMLWESNGANRVVTYLDPRPGIANTGVRSGTLLFEGRREGRTMYGTAYTFRRGCPPAPYEVEGQIRSETNVTLRGASPVRARGGCRVVRYNPNGGSATLRFRYLYRQ